MYPWVSHQTKPSRSQAIDTLKEMERSWDIEGPAPFDTQFGLPALPPDRSMHELHLKQLNNYKRYIGRHPPVLALGRLEQAMSFASIKFGALQTSWLQAQWSDPVAGFLVAKGLVVGTDI